MEITNASIFNTIRSFLLTKRLAEVIIYLRGERMKYQYYSREPNFRVGNIDVQSVSRPKNYKHFFPNGREKHGFIYVAEGSMTDFFQDGSESALSVSKGDLLFIPKGSVYVGTYTADKTKIKLVQFDLIHGELPGYLSVPLKIELPRASELIDAFFQAAEARVSRHPFYYLSCLYELLWQIDECCASLPKKYKKLQPALIDIIEYWNENRKISYYADLCDVSEATFRRLFREYMGLSAIDYRNNIRLENAKNKLQSGEYNVSEAAYESGFSNLSFFSRLYKKKYGRTPKKS